MTIKIPTIKIPADLNERSRTLIDRMDGSQMDDQGIRPSVGPLGCVTLDFGIDRLGTLAAGVTLAEICLAGLGSVQITGGSDPRLPLPQVTVRTDHPLAACIAAQYAGWPLATDDYFAMGSGAGRLLRGKENLLEKYALQEVASQGVLVLEASSLPTEGAVMQAGLECNLAPNHLIFCVARTASLPGTIQIVARSIETTLHKLDEIGFDLRQIVSALGTAPLPPIGKTDLQSIGWTNDAIIFGSQVNLWVDCDDSVLADVGERGPSESSSDFGRPFIEIFEDYDRDFYRIDKLLFSPAKMAIHNIRSGKTFVFGKLHYDLLSKSIGLLS